MWYNGAYRFGDGNGFALGPATAGNKENVNEYDMIGKKNIKRRVDVAADTYANSDLHEGRILRYHVEDFMGSYDIERDGYLDLYEGRGLDCKVNRNKRCVWGHDVE